MKSTNLRLAIFPLGRIHFDVDQARETLAQFRAGLTLRGYQVIGGEDILWDSAAVKSAAEHIHPEDVDLLIAFQATFSDSSLIKEIVQNLDAPLLLWSVPEKWTGDRLNLNSFTGMHLAAHVLHKNEVPFSYIYAAVDQPQAFEKLEGIARAARVIQALKSTKIGVIGDPPIGFETSEYDRESLKRIFGITVENRSLSDFFTRMNAVAPDRIKTVRERLNDELTGLGNLDRAAVDKTIAVSETLLDLNKENDMSGLAVRCWPEFFEEQGCSACGALSIVAEKGIACSCETDVLGTITQLILQMLSGTTSLGVDIVGFDFEENTAALWHCGMAPISMANPGYPKEAAVHSNRKLPLLMQFPFKPGVVTLARLTQADKQIKLIVSNGEMLDKSRPFTGTCGVLKFERPAAAVIETIMAIGMEHHISFTYGDFRVELEVIAKLLSLPIIHL